MVALTVGHHNAADATVQSIDILVVRCCDSGKCTNQSRPLGTVVDRYAGAHLRTGKSRVHIQRIGIKLREDYILRAGTLSHSEHQSSEKGNFCEFLHHIFCIK